MLEAVQLIEGGIHRDQRGALKFINSFDLNDIRRMYIIEPSDTNTIRAWQGHKLERKYFYASKGKFTIGLVQIIDWDNPNEETKPEFFELDAERPMILCIPGGYANGIKAQVSGSQLTVFSSSTLEEASKDEFKFSVDFWQFII